MSAAPLPPHPSPSLNADVPDRSVTLGVDADHPDETTIRLRPAPSADPILVMTLDPRFVETVMQGARLLRPTLQWADEVNRVDKLISTCERALAIYHDWVEERVRAAEAQREQEVKR